MTSLFLENIAPQSHRMSLGADELRGLIGGVYAYKMQMGCSWGEASKTARDEMKACKRNFKRQHPLVDSRVAYANYRSAVESALPRIELNFMADY